MNFENPSRPTPKNSPTEDGDRGVPSKYHDLPAEVVEELWQPPRYIGPRDAEVQAARDAALEQLKAQEAENRNLSQGERLPEEQVEGRKRFMDEVSVLLQESWRIAQERGLSFPQFLSKGCLSSVMYNQLIHEAHGVSYAEYTAYYQSNYPHLPETFDADIENVLAKAVADTGIKYRPQAQEGMLWFWNRTTEAPDHTDYRYYLNVPPENYEVVAQALSRFSVSLEQYNVQFKFKFRREFTELNRTDTCITYLELPNALNEEVKRQWQTYIEHYLQQLDSYVRGGSSLFTREIVPGISKAVDTRPKELRGQESYTSYITKVLARKGLEYAETYGDQAQVELLNAIIADAGKEYEELGYFTEKA
jgi:hypothetical protein